MQLQLSTHHARAHDVILAEPPNPKQKEKLPTSVVDSCEKADAHNCRRGHQRTCNRNEFHDAGSDRQGKRVRHTQHGQHGAVNHQRDSGEHNLREDEVRQHLVEIFGDAA